MQKGFTMVELVFVIVIIGILAAFAIPRLVATRDDARMSTLAHNVMVATTEIASYAVAKGETTTNFATMSKAVTILIQDYSAHQIPGQPIFRVPWKGINDCIVIRIQNQGGNTETLSVETNGTTSNNQCDRLRSLIDTSEFPIPLRGKLIQW